MFPDGPDGDWDCCDKGTPCPESSSSSSSSSSGGGCFPSTAKVKLENGKSQLMSELHAGDKVQTGIAIYKLSLL